jgi:hypothetical protein
LTDKLISFNSKRILNLEGSTSNKRYVGVSDNEIDFIGHSWSDVLEIENVGVKDGG